LIDLGDAARFAVTITDSTGALVNSAALMFTLTLPDQTTVTLTPTNDSTGKYHVDYTTIAEGRHVGRWVSTSPVFSHTQIVDVEAAADISLVALDDVKKQLRNLTTTADDELRSYILSVTENIESTRGVCAPRSFTARVDGDNWSLVLPYTPVMTLTSLTAVYPWSPSVNAATDVLIDNVSGIVTKKDGWQFYGPYTAVWTAGRSKIPASLRQACLLIVQYLWDTRRAGVGPQAGGQDVVQLPGWKYPIPPRAAWLLESAPQVMGFG
jgi:hypothetical protein